MTTGAWTHLEDRRLAAAHRDEEDQRRLLDDVDPHTTKRGETHELCEPMTAIWGRSIGALERPLWANASCSRLTVLINCLSMVKGEGESSSLREDGRVSVEVLL